MKRIIQSLSLLIVAAMLISLISCAKETPAVTTSAVTTVKEAPTTDPVVTDATTAPVVTENPRIWLDDIPDDLRFDDEVIRIAFADEQENPYTKRSLVVDENATDPVDVQMYVRNKNVENRFGFKIEPIQVSEQIAGLQDAINNVLAAGSDDYDIVVGREFHDIIMAKQGWFFNLNKLDDQSYLDLTKPYWGVDFLNTITYNDYLYWVAGDLNLRFMGGSFCMFVNERIYNSSIKATYGDLYDIVKNNEWTFDVFTQMADMAFRELDGNDKPSKGDTLGYTNPFQGDTLYSFAISEGVSYSEKQMDGKYKITLGDERTDKFVTKFYPMLYSRYSYVTENEKEAMETFANGNCLFTMNKVFQAESYLKEMEDDYLMVPVPMIDKEQGKYISDLHNGVNLYGIPTSCQKVTACTVLLEALCAESARIVKDAYYEQAVKYRYTRDPKSAEMIDIIHDSITTDFALAWTREVSRISEIFGQVNSASAFSSTLRKSQKSFETNLGNLLTALDKLEEFRNNQ